MTEEERQAQHEQWHVGKIFVWFQDLAGAIAARRSLNGRTFAGRSIAARFDTLHHLYQVMKMQPVAPTTEQGHSGKDQDQDTDMQPGSS